MAMPLPAIHPALAIHANQSPDNAMLKLQASPHDGLHALDLRHAQITPQNFRRWTPALTAEFQQRYPATAFRFHASVRLDAFKPADPQYQWFDLSKTTQRPSLAKHYWQALGACNDALTVDGETPRPYSLHSGLRPRRASMNLLADTLGRIGEWMGCEVMVETLYPHAKVNWWMNSWAEHEALLDSELAYAVDLSHLNILSVTEGRRDDLVQALLRSPRCREVHISGNDGSADQHTGLHQVPNAWWWALLDEAHAEAIVFSEGQAA